MVSNIISDELLLPLTKRLVSLDDPDGATLYRKPYFGVRQPIELALRPMGRRIHDSLRDDFNG